MEESCLLLIDLQNDYFPQGKMVLDGIEEAAANAQHVLKRFRERELPIIHVRHASIRPGSTFFVPGTAGAEINEAVAPRRDESVIVKNYPNSFRNTSLLQSLENIQSNNLVICGAMTHMCIDATTRVAFDLGFACTVIHDACATRDLKFADQVLKAAQVHAVFLAALSGTYADVMSTEELLKKMQ